MPNRQWRLAARPTGMVTEASFSFHEDEPPAVGDGQVLVRIRYVSVDPAMRGWIREDPGYRPPVPIGGVMAAPALGEVVESRHPHYQVGDIVTGPFGWQDFALIDADGLTAAQKLTPVHPLPRYLGVLGGTGLTAYFGLLDVGRPKHGDTVVVSAAAGATGSVAAQIARIKQCRVVGIAGGRATCAWLRTELGLDGVIDHRADDVGAALRTHCPDGIDLYFDNVGGPILDAAIERMSTWGRIVLCGMISGYNTDPPAPGPANPIRLITRRIRMEGFLVTDYAARFSTARRELSAWLATGALRGREDVREGFDVIPRTFVELFSGTHLGKLMVKI